jgi:hypothetical protein
MRRYYTYYNMSNRRKTLALNNEIYQKSIANGAELIGSKAVVGATGAQGEIGLIGPTGAQGEIGPTGPAASSSNLVVMVRSGSPNALSISYLTGLNYYLSSVTRISTFEVTDLPRTIKQIYVFKMLIRSTGATNYITATSIKVNLVDGAGPTTVPIRPSAAATAPTFPASISQTITLYVLTTSSFYATSSILYQSVS